jgi:hypothetical protein
MQRFDVPKLKSDLATLEKLEADTTIDAGIRMTYRNTIARIKEQLRQAEREAAPQAQERPSFAPQSTPPVNPPTTPEKRESVAAAQPRPNTANSGPSRTLVPPRTSTSRASAEDLPIAYRALPGWFRLKFNEVIELEYTQKELYHLLPEFRTFQRAVEYYRSLCEYWNIDVTPADVDLSWSRMSEPNQEIRRRVWEEIVRHAKNPQP